MRFGKEIVGTGELVGPDPKQEARVHKRQRKTEEPQLELLPDIKESWRRK